MKIVICLQINFSCIFEITERMLKGQCFSLYSLKYFLKTGLTLAFFKINGNFTFLMDSFEKSKIYSANKVIN